MKKAIALGLVLAAFLLFGCLELNYKHAVDREGNSDVSMETDLGAFESQLEQSESPCGNAPADVTCTFEDGVLGYNKHVTKDQAATEGLYDFEKSSDLLKTTYTLTVHSLPVFTNTEEEEMVSVNVSEAGATRFTDPNAASSADMLRRMNFEINYEVTMPGKVVSASGAQGINGSRATFDVLERMESGKDIEVTSEESICPLGAVLLILPLLGIVFRK